MPVAIGIIASAISGALSFGVASTWSVLAMAGGALLGTGLSGLQILLQSNVDSNMDIGGNLALADTGLGFDPVPNFSSTEASIPVVFGQTMVSGQLLQRRIYGTNYQQGFFIMGFGEAPLELVNLYIDGLIITDMPGFSSELHDQNHCWYEWSPLGGQVKFAFNNNSIIDWGKADGKGFCPLCYSGSVFSPEIPPLHFETISGPIITVYGSAVTANVYFRMHIEKEAACVFRVRLQNYNDPTEELITDAFIDVKYGTGQNSPLWSAGAVGGGWWHFALDCSVPMAGGHVDTAQVAEATAVFSGLSGIKSYRVLLDYAGTDPYGGNNRAQAELWKIKLSDTGYAESFAAWGTSFALIHLNYAEGISKQPQFQAVLRGHGREQYQNDGNPALCAYMAMTRQDPSTGALIATPLGLKIPPAEIDWPSVEETINFCNLLKGGNIYGTGGGYRFNRAYGAPIEIEKVLKEMTAAGRFSILRKGGKYYFKPDKAEPLSYVVSEVDEIIPGSLSCGCGGLEVPNRIDAQYVEAGLLYTVQRFNCESQADVDATGLRPDTLDLAGVTDQQQAFELAWFTLNCLQNNSYWAKFSCGLKTLRFCHVGDLIEIDTTHPVVTGKTWRITEVRRTQDHTFEVVMAQYNTAVYTSILNGVEEAGYQEFSPWYYLPAEYTTPLVWPGGSEGPSQIYNLAINGLTFNGNDLSTLVSIEYLYDRTRADLVEIEYSADLTNWVSAGTTVLSTFSFTWPMRYGVLKLRVRSQYQGVAGEWAVLAEYIEGNHSGLDYPGFGLGQFGWQPFGY